VGSRGKYALYPVNREVGEEAPATFTFDNLDLDDTAQEWGENEARMDSEEIQEVVDGNFN
jgi:hypothetical protein